MSEIVVSGGEPSGPPHHRPYLIGANLDGAWLGGTLDQPDGG